MESRLSFVTKTATTTTTNSKFADSYPNRFGIIPSSAESSFTRDIKF